MRQDNRIHYEIFRLATPIMIAILGFFCVRELDRIDHRLEIADAAIAEVRDRVASLDNRLSQDETYINRKR